MIPISVSSAAVAKIAHELGLLSIWGVAFGIAGGGLNVSGFISGRFFASRETVAQL